MMQEVEVLKTIPELVCSYFSEEQFTLSLIIKDIALKKLREYNDSVSANCGNFFAVLFAEITNIIYGGSK